MHPYYDYRVKLTTQDQLVFKGSQMVVPTALRNDVYVSRHSHGGLHLQSKGVCVLATQLKEYIAKCDVCLKHRAMPQWETLMSHEYTARPWAKVGADL